MLKVLAGVGMAQVTTMVVNLGRTKMLAVLLGPAGVGVTGIVDQLVQLVLHASAMSLPFASVKFLARAHSRDEATFRRTASSLLGAVVGLTAAGAAIALGVLGAWPVLLPPSLAGYGALLVPALLAVPAMALHGFFVQVFAAARQARGAATLILIIAIGLTVAAYVGISLGGVAGFYWASLVASYLIVGGVVWYLNETLGLRPAVGTPRVVARLLAENRDLLPFTLILYGIAIVLPLSHMIMKYAVLTSLGEQAMGLVQAALVFSTGLDRLLNPMNGLYLTPIVNRDIPAADKLRAASEFQGTLMMTVAVLAMPMVLFADWLVRWLFSSAFAEVVSIAYLFVVAQCIRQLAGVHQALLIGLEDLKAYGVLVGAAELSLGVVGWLLVPGYGILGAAVGVVFSNVALFGLTLARLSWTHGAIPSPRTLALMGGGVVSLLVAGGWSAQADAWDPAIIAAKLAVGAFFTAAALVVWRRDRSRRDAQGARRSAT